VHRGGTRVAQSPSEQDRALVHEDFDGDTGRGLGASHQTGRTALVVRRLERAATDVAPLRT